MSFLPLSIGRLLVGGVIIGIIGAYTMLVSTEQQSTRMHIDPQSGVTVLGETFVVSVVIESDTPVNAFSGEVTFDPKLLSVTQIDYDTSIADLWVEEPWYSAGEGSIRFAGGTTKSGGFTGGGALVTITFTPIAYGGAALGLVDAHAYAHDGFGTEAKLAPSIDALFTTEALQTKAKTVVATTEETVVAVVADTTDFDLSGDGAVTIADVSIFLLYSIGNDPRYDFNRDGTVDSTDFDLLLTARASR